MVILIPLIPIAFVIYIIVSGIYGRLKTKKNSANMERILSKQNFNSDKRMSTNHIVFEVLIDLSSKRIAICDYLKNTLDIISFNDIIECEILENGATIVRISKNIAAMVASCDATFDTNKDCCKWYRG